MFLMPVAQAGAEEAATISQYGITWTFDKPYPVGQFVTGDYWVIGPVTIVGVAPTPAPSSAPPDGTFKSRYGATALVDNPQLRNGSVITLKADKNEGYDSRPKNFSPELSATLPVQLDVNRTLISTISNDHLPVTVLCSDLLWKGEQQGALALKAAAVLTCLDKEPPADAFRPPYIGTNKPIYEAKNIDWNVLPKLAVPAGATVPSWAQYERYLQRPWIDNIDSWMYSFTVPSDNQPIYGREWARVTATASLMLMLDVPQAQKEKLAEEMIQLGIDVKGLAKNGRNWIGDGGHYTGRKWPILFAGLLLDNKDLRTVPPDTIFAEDQQTYYGSGFLGQTALFQIVFHTVPLPPYQEKDPATWTHDDEKGEGYRITNSGAWSEVALAALLMKARHLWNHDAYFDYCDSWMSQEDPFTAKRGAKPRPPQEGKTLDPFVDAMWATYRQGASDQLGGTDNTKWVWEGAQGKYEPDPKEKVIHF
jgi:hypothetical protein